MLSLTRSGEIQMGWIKSDKVGGDERRIYLQSKRDNLTRGGIAGRENASADGGAILSAQRSDIAQLGEQRYYPQGG